MNYGLLLLAFSTSAIGAPIVAGMVKDATGDFKAAFLIGGISCLVALAIAFFTRKPPLPGNNQHDRTTWAKPRRSNEWLRSGMTTEPEPAASFMSGTV